MNDEEKGNVNCVLTIRILYSKQLCLSPSVPLGKI